MVISKISVAKISRFYIFKYLNFQVAEFRSISNYLNLNSLIFIFISIETHCIFCLYL